MTLPSALHYLPRGAHKVARGTQWGNHMCNSQCTRRGFGMLLWYRIVETQLASPQRVDETRRKNPQLIPRDNHNSPQCAFYRDDHMSAQHVDLDTHSMGRCAKSKPRRCRAPQSTLRGIHIAAFPPHNARHWHMWLCERCTCGSRWGRQVHRKMHHLQRGPWGPGSALCGFVAAPHTSAQTPHRYM